jgi:hypothetical protein
MTRRSMKRHKHRNKPRKRKSKEALGDDSGDDDHAAADPPGNQYETPRAKEGTKRKASRALHDVDSGDEEVLATGRSQERRKRKARRIRHDADSDDEVMPINQLQLPFLQEETEEEVNLCEISLKALISRKQQLEKDLSRSRYVLVGS